MWIIISGILGVLGFIISLINLIHYFAIRRVNLDIAFLKYSVNDYTFGNDRIFVQYRIDNKSQLPIAITDIQLIIDGKSYLADYLPHEIFSYCKRSKGEIVEYLPKYNDILPINLNELSSRSDFLVFVIPQGILKEGEKDLTFQIRTNRHMEVQKTFVLNESVTLRCIPLK